MFYIEIKYNIPEKNKQFLSTVADWELPCLNICESSIIKKDNYDNDITVGVSYEDDDNGEEVYIYNVFVGTEYINIGNKGTNENKIPIEVIEEIIEVILELQ